MILGIDTGGTFTDFVLWDGNTIRVHKVLSTPDNPARAIFQGINDLKLNLNALHVVHGSTVATNAVLEGKLAKTVFVTNHGLKDILTIGRQARRELYNLTPELIPPPVPEDLCLEVEGRISAQGEMLEPFTREGDVAFLEQIEQLQPESVAISLLFSFVDSTPEEHLESLLPDSIFVTRSSALLPVYREYERGITTWINAATGPLMKHYLQQLASQLQPATLTIMQSSGDTLGVEQASVQSAHLLLSGPAGGLLGAKAMAGLTGHSDIMTFDMGGTSTDVALIEEDIRLTSEGRIAGYPVSVPMVDMHTIGAGGGSLAWLDDGHLLHVGPQSAGAAPGPACYGLGGKEPTVTDANMVLGRLSSQVAMGKDLKLDRDAAWRAVETIATQLDCDVRSAASGIIELANEHMSAALRVISVEKGYDPKDFMLVSFGGAGGLHVCDLADRLGINHAMVPAHAGVLSAYGMLVAPRGRRYMQTFIQPLAGVDVGEADSIYKAMHIRGQTALEEEGVDSGSLNANQQCDLRYIGQSSTLRVSWGALHVMEKAFHTQHEQRFGYSLDEPIEMVNLHCSVQAVVDPVRLEKHIGDSQEVIDEQEVYGVDQLVPVYDRTNMSMNRSIEGPAIIVESSATTWVGLQWTLSLDAYGNILLEKNPR